MDGRITQKIGSNSEKREEKPSQITINYIKRVATPHQENSIEGEGAVAGHKRHEVVRLRFISVSWLLEHEKWFGLVLRLTRFRSGRRGGCMEM